MKTVCCGRPLQEGLKIFAIVDLVFDNIQVAFVFLCLAFPYWVPDDYSTIHKLPQTNSSLPTQPVNEDTTGSDGVLVSSAFGSVFCLLISILLFYWLWTGARERSLVKCRKWLCIRIVFLTMTIIVSIFKAIEQQYYTFDGVFEFLKIYAIFELFVVKSFMNEIQGGGPILMKDLAPH